MRGSSDIGVSTVAASGEFAFLCCRDSGLHIAQ
jgi:hypothetical protein